MNIFGENFCALKYRRSFKLMKLKRPNAQPYLDSRSNLFDSTNYQDIFWVYQKPDKGYEQLVVKDFKPSRLLLH
jgi:hypothetical protein